jgi:hypothetical protein
LLHTLVLLLFEPARWLGRAQLTLAGPTAFGMPNPSLTPKKTFLYLSMAYKLKKAVVALH